MESIVNFFRTYPEMAIFLTIGVGFWIGSLKYKSFTLGTVTSVLLVGVLVGQMDIPISGPLKSVFFLLFLFAIGYSVGPQFIHSLRSSGIKQVIFAVVVCVAPNQILNINIFATCQSLATNPKSVCLSFHLHFPNLFVKCFHSPPLKVEWVIFVRQIFPLA